MSRLAELNAIYPHLVWTDARGTFYEVFQGEGGEQGDPLMPALYALAQHDSLVRAQENLHEDDHLFAFLDDLHVATTRDRARAAFWSVTSEVANGAGVRTHLGKLRMWAKAGGECPPGFEDFEPEVWTGSAEPIKCGIKVLGTHWDTHRLSLPMRTNAYKKKTAF